MAKVPGTPSQEIRTAVHRELRAAGLGVRQFERRIGLRAWSLRGILDARRPQVPSVDRAAEICAALGLEFYIGPPRTADRPRAVNWVELRKHLIEAAELAEELSRRENLPTATASQVEVVRGVVAGMLQGISKTAATGTKHQTKADAEAVRTVVLGLLQALRVLAAHVEPPPRE